MTIFQPPSIADRIDSILLQVFPRDLTHHFFIAGGMITSLLSDVVINDIDIFFTSKKEYKMAADYATRQKFKIMGDYTNALTMKGDIYYDRFRSIKRIQFIKKPMTPRETVDKFDFTICAIAYEPATRKFTEHSMCRKHIKDKILKLNEGTKLWLSWKRVKKYKSRGYKGEFDITSYCARCCTRFVCITENTRRCMRFPDEYGI